MKLRAKRDISILELSVHDAYDTGPFDEREIATALSRYLSQEIEGYEDETIFAIRSPDESYLDRFTLEGHTERLYDVAAVRRELPSEVVEALEKLEASKSTWILKDGSFTEKKRKS